MHQLHPKQVKDSQGFGVLVPGDAVAELRVHIETLGEAGEEVDHRLEIRSFADDRGGRRGGGGGGRLTVQCETTYQGDELLVRDGVGCAVRGGEGESVAQDEDVGEGKKRARAVGVLEQDVDGIRKVSNWLEDKGRLGGNGVGVRIGFGWKGSGSGSGRGKRRRRRQRRRRVKRRVRYGRR